MEPNWAHGPEQIIWARYEPVAFDSALESLLVWALRPLITRGALPELGFSRRFSLLEANETPGDGSAFANATHHLHERRHWVMGHSHDK